MIKNIGLGLAALAMAVTPTAAMAQDGKDRTIRVENHSGVGDYIVSVRIGNEHGRVYQLLRPRYISPGYNRTLNFDDGEGHGHCIFVAEAQFQSGTTATRTMNVCTTSVWKIYDIDNTVE